MILYYLIAVPVLVYLAFNVAYLLLSAIAGRLGRADDRAPGDALPGNVVTPQFRRIAVLIPGYKEDKVILDSVDANLQQTYPADRYDLIVIADSFKPATLQALDERPVKVLEVVFEQSTVQKSITAALESLPESQYDVVLVSDADNHMAADFLERINVAFAQGWRAVQGHRVAKNLNTGVAVLDAMNEEVNNHLFRKGQRALGVSASLIGSGMAFEPALMLRCMQQGQTVGGYDKELEMNLLLEGVKIAYLNDALIYDEKVQNPEVFEKQRTRWIAAQIFFVQHYYRAGFRALFTGRWHVANAFIKSLLLPRTLLLAAVGFVVFVGLLIGPLVLTPALWLLAGLVFALVISIPGYLWQKISARDLFITFPSLIFRMIRSLLNYKAASKKFIHTPHGEEAPVKP